MLDLTKTLKQIRIKVTNSRKRTDYPPNNLPQNKYILGKYKRDMKIASEDNPEKDPNYILGHRPW